MSMEEERTSKGLESLEIHKLPVTPGQVMSIFLGRAPESVGEGVSDDSERLNVADECVSGKHARIFQGELEEGGPPVFQIEDLGSSNGTFVNGKRILESTHLKPGDQIIVGRSVYQFEVRGEHGPRLVGLPKLEADKAYEIPDWAAGQPDVSVPSVPSKEYVVSDMSPREFGSRRKLEGTKTFESIGNMAVIGSSREAGRPGNDEDAIFAAVCEAFDGTPLQLKILADGMGGEGPGGAAAAAYMVQETGRHLAEYLKAGVRADIAMREAVRVAKLNMDATSESVVPSRSGTTIVLVVTDGKFGYVLNVGDSAGKLVTDLSEAGEVIELTVAQEANLLDQNDRRFGLLTNALTKGGGAPVLETVPLEQQYQRMMDTRGQDHLVVTPFWLGVGACLVLECDGLEGAGPEDLKKALTSMHLDAYADKWGAENGDNASVIVGKRIR